MDGNELHLCTPDFKGLLRLVSGKCYESGLDITQVHAYTLPRSDIAFDVFHLANLPSNFSRTDWLSSLSNTLKTRNGLTTDPRDILKGLEYHWNLDDLQDDGLRRLTFETKEHRPGYLFALSSGLYDSVGANIYAAKSSRENGDTFRVFFKSPQRDLKKVEDSLSDYFSQHK